MNSNYYPTPHHKRHAANDGNTAVAPLASSAMSMAAASAVRTRAVAGKSRYDGT